MTDKISFKEPSPEQLQLMQDYADICGAGMEIIMKCEINEDIKNAAVRMKESMYHFHAYVINGGGLKTEAAVSKPEISPTQAAARIVTLN